MNGLTHERCSELLQGYASGGLSERDQSEVEQHLRGCAECSMELRGLLALRPSELEPMTGPERDALARAVRSALAAPQRLGLLERFGRRFAPALGAVALVVIGVVTFVSSRDEAPSPAAGRDDATTTVQEAESDAAALPAGAPDTVQRSEVSSSDSETSDQGAATGGGAAGATSETTAEQAAGTVLRSGSSFFTHDQPFARVGFDVGSLLPDRIPARRDVDRFAAAAPDERVAASIRECAALTLSTSPHELVPSSAVYYPDDVLVIAFVWVDETTTSLNYELRGWIGGRCDQVSPIYARGTIE